MNPFIIKANITSRVSHVEKTLFSKIIKDSLKSNLDSAEHVAVRAVIIDSNNKGFFSGKSLKLTNFTFEIKNFLTLLTPCVFGTPSIKEVATLALIEIFRACTLELNPKQCFILVSLPKEVFLNKVEAFEILKKDFQFVPSFQMNFIEFENVLEFLSNNKIIIFEKEKFKISEKINIKYSSSK